MSQPRQQSHGKRKKKKCTSKRQGQQGDNKKKRLHAAPEEETDTSRPRHTKRQKKPHGNGPAPTLAAALAGPPQPDVLRAHALWRVCLGTLMPSRRPAGSASAFRGAHARRR